MKSNLRSELIPNHEDPSESLLPFGRKLHTQITGIFLISPRTPTHLDINHPDMTTPRTSSIPAIIWEMKNISVTK